MLASIKMARPQPTPRSKINFTATAVLLSLAILLALIDSPKPCLGQKSISPAAPSTQSGPAQPGPNQPSPGSITRAPVSRTVGTQPAPDTTPFPFLRIVLVLVSGLVIHAARLATKFRRYLGIGLFSNPYAILFMVFGAGFCGLPMTSEGYLKAYIPQFQSLVPWVTDLSGIAAILAIPMLRAALGKHRANKDDQQDLSTPSGSSSIFNFLLDEISLRLQTRMQDRITWACQEYSWTTIRLAAPRALADEAAIRPLTPADEEAAKRAIKAIPATDQKVGDKYQVLMVLVRCISYRLLFRSLVLAQRESQLPTGAHE
jgi:hypothetical protein